jgi:hypothetical protein
MTLTIDPTGYLKLRKEPNFEAKLSVTPVTVPAAGAEIMVQYTNLINALKSVPKDVVTVSIDPETKKLKIDGTMEVSIRNDGVENENKTTCRVCNVISYWSK